MSPRLALGLIWIFTSWVSDAFGTFIVPLLGLIFAPWTALLWTLAYAIGDGVTAWSVIAVIVGVIADASSYAGSAYKGKEYRTA